MLTSIKNAVSAKVKKSFAFKVVSVKSLPNDECMIEGYANTKSKDRVGDCVLPGAFQKSLSTYLKNPVLLANHNWEDVVGRVVEARITDDGLYIKARISDTRPDVKTLIREGCLSTFSIGYNEVDADYDESTKTKYIKELELLEISVVSVPANTEASFTVSQTKDENVADQAKPAEQSDGNEKGGQGSGRHAGGGSGRSAADRAVARASRLTAVNHKLVDFAKKSNAIKNGIASKRASTSWNDHVASLSAARTAARRGGKDAGQEASNEDLLGKALDFIEKTENLDDNALQKFCDDNSIKLEDAIDAIAQLALEAEFFSQEDSSSTAQQPEKSERPKLSAFLIDVRKAVGQELNDACIVAICDYYQTNEELMTTKELIEKLRAEIKSIPAAATAKADGPAADGGNAAPQAAQEDNDLDKQILEKLNALAEAVAKLLEDESAEEGQAGEEGKGNDAAPAPKDKPENQDAQAMQHECPKCGYAGEMKAKKPEEKPKDQQDQGDMDEEEVEKQLADIDAELEKLDEQANG